jgi:hypothetical protein
LQDTYMNIFDVVEQGGRMKRVVRTFASKEDLLQYSGNEGKIRPKKKLKNPGMNPLPAAVVKSFR